MVAGCPLLRRSPHCPGAHTRLRAANSDTVAIVVPARDPVRCALPLLETADPARRDHRSAQPCAYVTAPSRSPFSRGAAPNRSDAGLGLHERRHRRRCRQLVTVSRPLDSSDAARRAVPAAPTAERRPATLRRITSRRFAIRHASHDRGPDATLPRHAKKPPIPLFPGIGGFFVRQRQWWRWGESNPRPWLRYGVFSGRSL